MPKLTEQQIKERDEKVKAQMIEVEEQYERENKIVRDREEDAAERNRNQTDNYYIQVLNENEYGLSIGPNKIDDTYEEIIPFRDTIPRGHIIYITRNNQGVLEQRIKESDYDYAKARKTEYPKIREQLDMIYHDIDGWKETIKDIKERNPKGE